MTECPNIHNKINIFNGRCCCNCKNRLADYSHPCTDSKSILQKRGYICYIPEDGLAFSGWPEHGLCELHIWWIQPQRYSILYIPSGEFISWPNDHSTSVPFRTTNIKYAEEIIDDLINKDLSSSKAEFEIVEI